MPWLDRNEALGSGVGFNPMQPFSDRPSPLAIARQGMAGADLDAMFGDDEDEKDSNDFLQALPGQFPAGTNLDLEI